MEQPYAGRATIQDNITDLQIIVPAKRNWFITIFLGAWLCGWVLGELFAIRTVTGFGADAGRMFMMVWLVGWTVGGFFALRFFLWSLIGKELITVGQGRLKIEKKGLLFSRPKEYDLNEVKNIRAQEDNADYYGRRNSFATFNMGGTIRFDYGMKTVKFAGGVDEAEAGFIINKLKERNLLPKAWA